MFFGNYSFFKKEEGHNKLFDINISKLIGVFNAVYETHSLKEAGKITLKTKSSMSKSLKQLEYILGEKLFNRNGRNGLSVTQFGERFFFYTKQFKIINKSISESFDINYENKLEVCCHVLGSFYFTKIAAKDNSFFNISTSDKENACAGLISGRYDLIFFPFDNIEISKIDKLLFCTDMMKKYDLCLFMNKNNVFANVDDKDIGWEELKKMNIVPLGKSVAFNLYLSSLSPSICTTTTKTLDILLIKNGIDENLWTACLGEEFINFCDKKKTVIKRVHSMKNLGTEINWFFCYKSTNFKKTEQIKKIIDLFNKMFM